MFDYLIALDMLLLDISDYLNLNDGESLTFSEEILEIISKYEKE